MMNSPAGRARALIAVAAAGLLTACGGHATTTHATPSIRPRPVVTAAQARGILTHYEAVNNVANAGLEANLLEQNESGPLLQEDTAQYKQFSAYTTAEQKRYRQPFTYSADQTQYMIPSGGNWFMANCPLAGPGTAPGSHDLVVFQRGTDGTWRMAAAVILAPGVRIPALARDKDGSPTAISGAAAVGAVALNKLPDLVNDLHLTGGKGPGKQLADTAVKRAALRDYATRTDWVQPPTERSIFHTGFRAVLTTDHVTAYRTAYALKTADKGALVVIPSYFDRDDYTTNPAFYNVTPGPDQDIYIQRRPGETLQDVHSTYQTQNVIDVPPSGPVVQLAAETQLIAATGVDSPPSLTSGG